MNNYLLRLGWGHGDTDIISTEEAVKLFRLEDIGQSPSRMDFTKLAHVNAHYMRQCSEDRLLSLLLPFVEKTLGKKPDELGQQRLKKGLHDLKERAHTMVELAQAGLFYVRPRPLALDEQARKTLDEPARILLKEIRQTLENLNNFKSDTIESSLKEFSTQKGLKLGKVAQKVFPQTSTLGATAGDVFYSFGFLIGILLWAFGLVWLTFAVITLLMTKSFPFNMGWWALTFPLGVFTTCTCTLGDELPSRFFSVLGTVSLPEHLAVLCIYVQ